MENRFLNGAAELAAMSVLSKGPLHAYAILRRIERATDGTLSFGEATIYPMLHALEGKGYLSSRRAVVRGRPRIIYRLTARGRSRVDVLRTGWAGVARAVERILSAS